MLLRQCKALCRLGEISFQNAYQRCKSSSAALISNNKAMSTLDCATWLYFYLFFESRNSFICRNENVYLNKRFWMKKVFSLGDGIFLHAETEKCFVRLKICLFLSERFWMKKVFSLGDGVFLYAESGKCFFPKETPLSCFLRQKIRSESYSALVSQ